MKEKNPRHTKIIVCLNKQLAFTKFCVKLNQNGYFNENKREIE